MARTTEDQDLHDIGFMWENQSWDFSFVDKSGESKEKLSIELPNQNEGNGEEHLVNEKHGRQESAHGNGKEVINTERKEGKSCGNDNEIHQRAESKRRKKMRSMFDTLHALLPGLSYKADRCEIVDEAVNRIKNLKEMVEELEKQKKERLLSISSFEHGSSSNNFTSGTGNPNLPNSNMLSSVPQHPTEFHTWSSPNVVLNICGIEAQLSIFATRRPGLLTTIALVLEKHEIDVITTNIFRNGNGKHYMILVGHANRISYQLNQQTTALEEIYKIAAREIMLCIA